MLHLTVIEERVHTPRALRRVCSGDESTKACAVLDMGNGICTIYVPHHTNKATYIHELNHCHGWRHNQVDTAGLPSHTEPRAHKKPWEPFSWVPPEYYPPEQAERPPTPPSVEPLFPKLLISLKKVFSKI